jgi:cytochrome P450
VVMTFRRTAVEEVELGGKKIIPGDKVVLFYSSGNRDADVFADPDRFDLSRDPNPHLGFGGGGAHFCLGNQLAKGALRALFRELLTRIPDFEAGTPDLLGTNFVRGVKRLPFRFTPER